MCKRGNCPFSNLKSFKVYKLITFLKRLKILKEEWQRIPTGTRQTDGKNLVWFGDIERKLAKLSKTVAEAYTTQPNSKASSRVLYNIFESTCGG
jgi:hypothetical protein